MRRITCTGLFCSMLLLVIAAGVRAEPYDGEASREAAPVAPEAWAEVTGWVVDAQGNPVPGARVVRLGVEGGEALTDDSGAFRLVLRHDGAPISLVFETQSSSEKMHAVERVEALRDGERAELGVVTLGGACEPQWTEGLFDPPAEMNDWVVALTVFDDGSGPALYAGGSFITAGGVASANYIAKWDGSSWSSLGSGMNNTVSALTVFDDGSGPALYAGGNFTSAGGVAASRVAKWDGASWSALGTGISGTVLALAGFDDGSGPALYAGGLFETAGGVTVNRIAKWDGSSWSAMGSGTNNTVTVLTVFDDGSGPALYMGGVFNFVSGIAVGGIARWNGSSWSGVSIGVDGGVSAMTVFDDGSGPALYAGGGFSTAGGADAHNIARWDGSSWSGLGSGIEFEADFPPYLTTLAAFDDGSGPALYAAGYFSAVGGVAANNIARWDGSSWSALGAGVAGDPPPGSNPAESRSLAVFDDGSGPSLYVGGGFLMAGGALSSNIARWQGCSVASTPCPGDANGDDVVDFNDITTILANWLSDYTPGTGPGDANGDGVVDFNDITAVLANWLSACP